MEHKHQLFLTLRPRPKLLNQTISLQFVNNTRLNVDGRTKLDFTIRGLRKTHSFYACENMERSMILGRFFQFQMDLDCFMIYDVLGLEGNT